MEARARVLLLGGVLPLVIPKQLLVDTATLKAMYLKCSFVPCPKDLVIQLPVT